MSETVIVTGKAAVAAHFGVSVRQVRKWELAGMPGRVGRTYDLVKIQLWRDQKQGKGAEGDPRQAFLSPQRGKDFQDERKKRMEADLLEIQLKKRRGEVIELSELKQLAISRIIAVKQGLRGLARSLPALLPIPPELRREAEAIITERVRELLVEFARPLPEKFSQGGI
jgi:hypothetical protein